MKMAIREGGNLMKKNGRRLVSFAILALLLLSIPLIGACAAEEPATTPAATQTPATTPAATTPATTTPAATEEVPTQIRIFSSSVGSQSLGVHSLWADTLRKGLGIPAGAFPGGAVPGLKLVGKGEGEFCYGSPSLLIKAREGGAPFEEAMPNLRVLCNMVMPSTNAVLVRNDSDIQSVQDFIGKRISLTHEGGTADIFGRQVLRLAGVTIEKIEAAGGVVINQSIGASAQAMQDGDLDVVFLGTAVESINTAFVPINERFGLRQIPIDDELLQKVLAESRGMQEYTCPAGIYAGDKEPVKVLALGLLLCTRSELPEDFIYDVMATLLDNDEMIQKTHDGWPLYSDFGITERSFLTVNVAPMHPGAVKYWTENRNVNLADYGVVVEK